MKVKELIELLQKANTEADVKLFADCEEDLCLEQIVIKGDVVDIDLYNFIDEVNDFNAMCGAL